MTATRLVRILYQATFLALFLWLLERLAAGDPRAWPYALFQWFDPLAGAGVPLAAKTLPAALALSAQRVGEVCPSLCNPCTPINVR